MSEEEIIDCIRDMINYVRFDQKRKYTNEQWLLAQENALDLIQKQQKEIEYKDQEIFELVNSDKGKLRAESKKKDKIIDEMAKEINILNNTDNVEIDCFIPNEFSNIDNCIKIDCKECIKQYFERKVER